MKKSTSLFLPILTSIFILRDCSQNHAEERKPRRRRRRRGKRGGGGSNLLTNCLLMSQRATWMGLILSCFKEEGKKKKKIGWEFLVIFSLPPPLPLEGGKNGPGVILFFPRFALKMSEAEGSFLILLFSLSLSLFKRRHQKTNSKVVCCNWCTASRWQKRKDWHSTVQNLSLKLVSIAPCPFQ